jgi:hypothetical protein
LATWTNTKARNATDHEITSLSYLYWSMACLTAFYNFTVYKTSNGSICSPHFTKIPITKFANTRFYNSAYLLLPLSCERELALPKSLPNEIGYKYKQRRPVSSLSALLCASSVRFRCF